MKLVVGLVRSMRPHQWAKNLFVFAPLLFAQDWHQQGRVLRVAATFGMFCLMASGVYLLNDVADREADRAHPRKKLRPIAAGIVPPSVALVVSCLLIAGSIAWARFGLESKWVTELCVTYVSIQVLYTFWLKRMVIVDVLCISSGFVLRLLAGGSAAWVPQSTWILVCTIFLSLFLALCKRRHEVVSLGQDAAAHRAILADYPPALLDQLIGVATACTLVTYALYTVDARTAEAHRLTIGGQASPVLAATIPFVLYGMFRYLFLVYRRDGGGSPTSTLLRDVPMLVNGVLYVAAILAIFRRFAGA